MTPTHLYNLAARRGIYLSYWNETSICALPESAVDPEIEKLLIRYKPTLIPWLKKRAVGWLHLCRQILQGEFDGADGETLQNFERALSGDDHPLRQRALEHLRQMAD